MSRLIIKNLPSYLTQDQLRSHFTSSGGPGGTLTDVKVVLKPDGTSRRFGFVGYKTQQEAEKARKWFDRTFIDSSRISVTAVEGVKDAPPPRPNKRPRLAPPESEPMDSKSKLKPNRTHQPSIAAGDVQLQEFMRVMAPRSKKGPSWKDSDALPVSDSSKPTPMPMKNAVKSRELEPPTSDNNDAELEESKTIHETDAPAKQGDLSDLDWLKRHMKQNLSIETDKAFEQSDEEDNVVDGGASFTGQVDGSPTKNEPSAQVKETIIQTGRLFIRNLPFTCTQEELEEHFKSYGEVSQVHIPLDPLSKSPKGLAYVTFSDPSSALSAFEALDKTSFQGRLLHILPAVDRKGAYKVEDREIKRGNTLREDREAKRKAMAGKEFNWGMLYMNSDAVISSVADRMGLSKADILNPESSNAAVKLALAETHVIQETKTFLEENGVVLSSLQQGQRVTRSDTTILVKNIPYGTSSDEIRSLFDPYGELVRVLVPPAGTMAVVEFLHPDEGRKAFKGVAYRRLGNSVIYLEKGPVGMFAESSEDVAAVGPVVVVGGKPVKVAEAEAQGGTDPGVEAGTTLFVKNLSFGTTTARLTSALQHLPAFVFARIQTKPDPKHPEDPNKRLSMGYGFVGFKDKESARKAAKSLEGFVLDGHELVVKFAGRGKEGEDEEGQKVKDKAKGGTKMIVKNVPFEATKKDIRELFGSHGHLKSVRLPKNHSHRSRGFAFLEFTTHHEAQSAYAALRHTHLLGRHLVLEWAEDGEVDLDELRRKAGVGWGEGREVAGKKRKLQFEQDGENDPDIEIL